VVSALVGISLSTQNHKQALRFAKVCYLLCMIYIWVVSIIMVLYGNKIISYFDSKVDAIERIEKSIFTILAFVIL